MQELNLGPVDASYNYGFPYGSKGGSTEAHNVRGIAYSEKGKYDEAISAFSKAIALDPEDAIAYCHRAVAYYNKGRFYRAIDDFTKVISLKPNDILGYYSRGVAYRSRGIFDKAIQDFNTVINLTSSEAIGYYSRGATYHRKGEIDRAITDYDKAIELDSDDAEAYYYRGAAYRDKGEVDKAIANYDKAIRLKPQFAEVYTLRGIIHHGESELEKAIEDHSKAIELKPKYAEAYVNRGVAYRDKGELEKAIEDHSKAIELKPELAIAYNQRGNAYCDKGEVGKAIVDYTHVIKLQPKVARSYYTRGEAWLRVRKWEEAQRDLTAAILQGVNIADKFHNTHGSITVFEKKIGVKLPEDIVDLLTPRQGLFEIDKETRVALAMKYYENQELSSGSPPDLQACRAKNLCILWGITGFLLLAPLKISKRNLRMPAKPVISNNSPLVALWHLGRLSLLQDLYTEVWIPQEVEKEFLGTEKKSRQEALNNTPWIKTVDLTDSEKASVYDRLDSGEAAVLALASEHEARLVIIDEKKARQEILKIGLPFKGTVGILLEAKEEGLIDEIKPLLIVLQEKGIYLDESLIAYALREAGEI